MKETELKNGGELRLVPLNLIDPSPYQARRTFEKSPDWPEFVESIRTHGVIQPGVAREKGKRIELVAGERRLRASVEAKLATMPLIVRPLTDAEVQDIVAIENLQREGLNEIEEAQGYADWITRLMSDPAKGGQGMKTRSEAIEYIESRIHRKRATIYERLKLVKLSKPVKEVFLKGGLDASKAALFSTVPESLHGKLLKEATQKDWQGGTMSVRKLREHIDQNYTRQLTDAPFPTKEEWKVLNGSTRIACKDCPLRSGNIEGFAGNPNICTNVPCFEARVKDHNELTLAKAQENGTRVIPTEEYEAKQHTSAFTKADGKCYADSKYRTYKELAKKADIKPAVTIDDEGALIEVFTKEDTSAILKANKIQERSYGGGSDRKALAAYQKKKKEFTAKANVATGLMLPKLITVKGIDSRLWKRLAEQVMEELGIERTTFVAKRRGLAKTQNEAFDALDTWLTAKERTDQDRMEFIIEGLLCASWDGGGWQTCKWDKEFEAMAKMAGVNLEKLPPEPLMPGGKVITLDDIKAKKQANLAEGGKKLMAKVRAKVKGAKKK